MIASDEVNEPLITAAVNESFSLQQKGAPLTCSSIQGRGAELIDGSEITLDRADKANKGWEAS